MTDVISDSARAYLRWALTEHVGPMAFSRLAEAFGGAEAALKASPTALERIRGIGSQKARAIAASRDTVDIQREIEAAADAGVRIICRDDGEWPAGLKNIPDAPIVLFVRGELLATDAVSIAIVGSRNCSIYGSEQARRFGELLAGVGFTVVSGLARGIDAFAHHGALDAGGRTVAVMGRGLSEVYPPENAALADRILEHGAWISELPMHSEVRAGNFPGRNRIIAGMTLGTLVVEAGGRSGALITARLAGDDYNREVFAVPGRLGDPYAIGTNALIRDGKARLVTGLDDILDSLGAVGDAMRQSSGERPRGERQLSLEDANRAARASPALSDVESTIYDAIGAEPLLQDRVLADCGLPAGEVLAAFTSLELKGLIKRLPGQMVKRAR